MGDGAVRGATALGALPRTYQVKRVDSPSPETDRRFGLGHVSDVNADGKNDLLTGTDKHGTVPGRVFVVSGANGSILRNYQRPDTDLTVGSGDRPTGFGAVVGRIPTSASAAASAATPATRVLRAAQVDVIALQRVWAPAPTP